jgi:hypothetical protein
MGCCVLDFVGSRQGKVMGFCGYANEDKVFKEWGKIF